MNKNKSDQTILHLVVYLKRITAVNIFKIVYPALPELKSISLDLAGVDDAEFIALLSKHYVESGMSGWSWNPVRIIRQIENPDALVIVGRSDDCVVAAAIVEFGDLDAHLSFLAVEPLFQRTGVGSCLVRYIENSAFLEGNSRVFLEVRLSNPGARDFYRSLGYKEIQIRKNYYKGNEAAVYMMRYLQPSPNNQILKGEISD